MPVLRGLMALSAPVWRAALRHRLRKGKETPESIGQKLMRAPAQRPQGPLVWGHAVGVGEAQALIGLFSVLAERLPQHHFLITTTARTSAQALAGRLPTRCQHQFAPIDTPASARAFLAHWQPQIALWCEMDLWPCLIHATAQRRLPMVLVNARVPVDALARKRRVRGFHAALLGRFDRLYAQDAGSASGLIDLGAPASRVKTAGTVKALARPLGCDADALARERERIGRRPVWVAASSHEGEESLLLEAHTRLRRTQPDALLVMAPRYPARGPEVAARAAVAGAVALRSRGEETREEHAVHVADTIGEMGLWYRLAPVAFVGGSLVGVGGHNPFEPLALGCRVLHGPQVHNFAQSYAELDAAGLAHCTSTAEEIAERVARAWAQGAAPPLSDWPGARGAWQMVDELVEMIQAGGADGLSAPPPGSGRRA